MQRMRKDIRPNRAILLSPPCALCLRPASGDASTHMFVSQPLQHEGFHCVHAPPSCSSAAAADARLPRCGSGPRFCATCGVCADFNACSRTSTSTSTRTTRTRFAAAYAWSSRLDAKRSSSDRSPMIVATPWDMLRSPELNKFSKKDVQAKQLEDSAIDHWTPKCATFSCARELPVSGAPHSPKLLRSVGESFLDPKSFSANLPFTTCSRATRDASPEARRKYV
jgi:hypothetical protein